MGNRLIEAALEWVLQNEQRHFNSFVNELPDGPDVRVNQTIVRFCSLDSSNILRRHYERRRMEAGDCAADWIKNLAEKLAALTPAPALAGLGALAVAVFIDTVSFSPPEESTKDALRCVFAEEKASEVWDLIDECLKRYMMHINNNLRLRSDLERIECQLSTALTKLKNSMLRDGHMTTEALKAWVNGAAFHIQMLIHLVRLGVTGACDPVETLLSTYQTELDRLFRDHKEMIREKSRGQEGFIVSEDSQRYNIGAEFRRNKYFEAYYDREYDQQKREIEQHFSDVAEKLQSLVHQRGSFNFN